MQRDKLRYVLGAATITSLALLLILALGRPNAPATVAAASQDVAALQEENARLAQTVQEMQQREAQYQSEIAKANETIRALSIQAGLVSGDLLEGSSQPFSAESLPLAPDQLQGGKFFSLDERHFHGHGLEPSHDFFGDS